MPWPIYLAFKQLFPTGRASFFTIIATIGITLGVTLMLMVTSIMGGFGYQAGRMIVDTQGELQIRGRSLIQPSASLEKIIADTPEVLSFAPLAQGMVMTQQANYAAVPLIQGFDIARMKQVVPLEKYIVEGSLDDLDDDSVILSSLLAVSLHVHVGDTVSVYSPLMLQRASRNEVLLPREVRVAGIFRIGHQQLDSSTVICPLRLVQDLYGLGHEIHGYNLRLAPGADPDRVASALAAKLPPGLTVFTWMESNAEFQSILVFEQNMIFFLMTFIVIVAAFSIMSSLLVTVVRKTREIGLLGAMGGTARDVALSFCAQGLFIGCVGTTAGLALGFTLLHYRNAIVHVVARLSVGQETFEKFYIFSSLPAHTVTKDVVSIVVFSILASTLAGLIPAWRAARLKPVEALRSE